MTTLLDHKVTLAYLAYLGYPDDNRTSAVKVTRPRKTERKKGKVTRNVFLCYVCGAAGSGKTSLLRAFARKPYKDAYEPTSKPISVVNSVEIDGVEKYLVVSNFPPSPHSWLTTMSRSCKNLGHNTRQRLYEIRGRLILRT
jgi:Ras family protein T1